MIYEQVVSLTLTESRVLSVLVSWLPTGLFFFFFFSNLICKNKWNYSKWLVCVWIRLGQQTNVLTELINKLVYDYKNTFTVMCFTLLLGWSDKWRMWSQQNARTFTAVDSVHSTGDTSDSNCHAHWGQTSLFTMALTVAVNTSVDELFTKWRGRGIERGEERVSGPQSQRGLMVE